MAPFHLILLVLALVLAIVAAFWQPQVPRAHLGWLAFAAYVLAALVPG